MPRIPLRWNDLLFQSETIIKTHLQATLPPRSKGRERKVTRTMIIAHALETWAEAIAGGEQLTRDELESLVGAYHGAQFEREMSGTVRKSTNTTISDDALGHARLIFEHLVSEKARLGFGGYIPEGRAGQGNRELSMYLALLRRARQIRPDFQPFA